MLLKNVKFTILFSCFFLLAGFVFSQGYKIKVKITGLSDTTLLLGHHFGNKKRVIDTFQVDAKGETTMEGDEPLKAGIYLVVTPDMNYVEMLVDEDQKFSLETDTADLLGNITVKGSDQNDKFYEYQHFMIDKRKLSQKLRDSLRSIDKNEKLKNKKKEKITEDIKQQLTQIDEDVKAYWQETQEKHPGWLLSVILKGMTEVEVPEPPRDEEGNLLDSAFQYKYYKNHYFDNIDFSDSRILRTPVFEGKLKNYFQRVIVKHPDSLSVEAVKIVEKSQANEEMFKFVLPYLLNYFEKLKIMCMDKVFVTLGEEFYLSGQATWADSAWLEKLRDRVYKIKPNLCGNKAPEMRLKTIDHKFISLHRSIRAKFLIVAFWEPHCGHCKKVIPKLHNTVYQKYKDKGVECLAVYTQHDTTDWKKFVREKGITDWINAYDEYYISNFRNNYDIYSTPVIYLLDDEKKIIAKRLGVDQIDDLIDKLLKEKEEEEKKAGNKDLKGDARLKTDKKLKPPPDNSTISPRNPEEVPKNK